MNSIQKILEFLSFKKSNTLIINEVSEEIGLFYLYVIERVAINEGIEIKISDIKRDISISEDLFFKPRVFLFKNIDQKNIKKIDNQNIYKIFTTNYKNYKAAPNSYLKVNGYEFKKDIDYYITNVLKFNNKIMINFIQDHPSYFYSEISKYEINKDEYRKNINIYSHEDQIKDVRLSIYNLKVNNFDLRKYYNFLKKEAHLKKFNFLTF